MFGLWFSIIGLVFGVLCSYKAREQKRLQQGWFMLGFVLSFIALGFLYLTQPQNTNSK